MHRFVEKNDYMNLTWLNYQYYELGRSLQDIADDQGVSMMTINKWVDKIDKPHSVKTEEKSANFCPHCGQKLPPTAIFCIVCGEKVYKDKVIPSRSDGLKENLMPKISELIAEKKEFVPDPIEEKTVTEIPPLKDDVVQPKPSISNRRKEKLVPKIPDIKVEEVQVVPTDVKVDVMERLKELRPICKFCGMDLNKKATFCPQCGTKVKKK